MDYVPGQPAQYKICVYRNHSFELIEHTLPIYLDYAGIGVEFVYSDYDDSLSFLELPDADMLILWLDMERYKTDDPAGFINSRISYLLSVFKKPVLLVTVGGSLTSDGRVLYFDAGAFLAENSAKRRSTSEWSRSPEQGSARTPFPRPRESWDCCIFRHC